MFSPDQVYARFSKELTVPSVSEDSLKIVLETRPLIRKQVEDAITRGPSFQYFAADMSPIISKMKMEAREIAKKLVEKQLGKEERKILEKSLKIMEDFNLRECRFGTQMVLDELNKTGKEHMYTMIVQKPIDNTHKQVCFQMISRISLPNIFERLSH
jgi:hypothetical protein